MGGPTTYTNDLGGYEHMLSKHRGLHITGEQRLRFVTLLSRAADDADLPDDPEFRAAVMGYAEWARAWLCTIPAMPTTSSSMRPFLAWGWGVAPPYEP